MVGVVAFFLKWDIFFKTWEDREQAGVIAEFWRSSEIKEIVVPCNCRLGGFVYGHVRYQDSADVFTSPVKKFVRVEQGSHKSDIPHDLCYAETASGNRYYFFTDGHHKSFSDYVRISGDAELILPTSSPQQ